MREMTKDTEVIAQYKTMRETVVYLTNLNYEDTESIMLEKLDLQVTGGRFSWNGLNTLCWAIGSISGAMSELGGIICSFVVFEVMFIYFFDLNR